MIKQDNTQALSALRNQIDEIDETLHQLLMQRSTVIDALVEAKGADGQRLAFRPAREAAMMQKIVSRHQSRFPITSIVHIWREIISTFTYLQSPYNVYVDSAYNSFAMHDMARFHFGFSVELFMKKNPYEVIDQIRSTQQDLGLIAFHHNDARGPWWTELVNDQALTIIAVLPFIITSSPFNIPCCIVAPLLLNDVAQERQLVAAQTGDELNGLQELLNGRILASARSSRDKKLLDVLLDLPNQEDDVYHHSRKINFKFFEKIGTVAQSIVFDGNDIT